MKYIDGFRNPKAARAIGIEIVELAQQLADMSIAPNIMEVCGSHTMAIARYGIRDVLPSNVELLSGPGCPVCVTDSGYIDTAIELAEKGCIVTTFGDMLNVPGSDTTLAACRAAGGDVRICYSPSTALELARQNIDRQVVFLAIGFETTIAPIISIVNAARNEELSNFSLLTAFKLVPPALRALLADQDVRIDAFLCPAHVSAIIGSDAYNEFTGPQGVPCVVAGFEPLDILRGISGVLQQISMRQARVDNQYSRVVRAAGNQKAQDLMKQFLQPADVIWRGIGTIPLSGLKLRPEFSRFDAQEHLNVSVQPGKETPGCLCGDVIKGKNQPPDCNLFASRCTPENAIGPCMVSSEGTCAAYYKYRRLAPVPSHRNMEQNTND